MRRPTSVAFLLALLMAGTGSISADYRGYIEVPYTPTVCIQESHFLLDPCTGNLDLLRESATLDLDAFACKYVIVDGPDIGITCPVIQPVSVVPSSPTCPNQFGMWLTEEAATGIQWYRVPCTLDYDLIRGRISGVTPGATQIDLGPVTCLADDVPQTNLFNVTGPSDPDTPPVGATYFYVVRARGTAVPETYGFSSNSLERLPSSGDCSF